MAAPTYKFLRDWIMKNLSEVSMFVSEKELSAVFAEITREITVEVGLRELVVTQDLSYLEANQYVDLPSDCAWVDRISITEEGEERFQDVLDWRDTGRRKYYADKSLGYAYCVGRRLYLSWQVSADTTVKCYYYPFLSADTITLDTTALGATQAHIPVILSKAFRYGCLADIMNTYGRTQVHVYKAQRWQATYEKLVSRARKFVREVMPPHEVKELSNF